MAFGPWSAAEIGAFEIQFRFRAGLAFAVLTHHYLASVCVGRK
jgi:hypothetical protein